MKKTNQKGKIASNLLLLVCMIVFCLSAYQLIRYLTEAKKGEQEYSELSSAVTFKTPSGKDKKKENPPEVDFDALEKINPDVVGWIMIEGTVIDYPIVQGEDNKIYLGETFYHQQNQTGAIFLDVNNRKDFSSDNSILYGHNLKTGKMFGSLKFYEDKEYWEDHPYIWIITKEKSMKYHIFTSYRTKITDAVYTLDFADKEEYDVYLKRCAESGYYDTGVKVGSDNTILTLSTCVSQSEDGRRVVQAIKVYEEENK